MGLFTFESSGIGEGRYQFQGLRPEIKTFITVIIKLFKIYAALPRNERVNGLLFVQRNLFLFFAK